MSDLLKKCGEGNQFDVIVVGAGVSGLTAAYQLLHNAPDLKVLVLEAKDRIGGRTLTTKLKSADGTDDFDLGGQWVANTQKDVMKLLSDLGLDTYPQYENGTKLMMLDDGVIRSYSSFIPKISWLSLIDLQWFLYKFEKLAAEIDMNAPYNHPRAAEFDSMSMETFKQKHVYTQTTKQLVNICIRAAMGCDPVDLSVLFLLTYARGAGGFMKLLETSNGGAQEKRVKGGCLQISERLARYIKDENIRLSTPVKAIYQCPDAHESYTVGVLTESEEMFACRYIIMATPLHLAADLRYEPALPEKRLLLMKNMPVGHMSKFIVTYPQTFWRSKGYSGEIVCSGGPSVEDECDMGPLCVVFDATSSRGNPALVGLVSGKQVIQWRSKPFAVRRSAILKELAKFLGDEALQPLDFVEKDWFKEPYNGGCPVNIGTPGAMKYMNEQFRSPFHKLHWAGTETATSWCGYISGAVQSGRRAAIEVLFHLRPASLTTTDLLDTAYSPKNVKRQTSSHSHYLYWFSITAVTVAVFFYLIQPVSD